MKADNSDPELPMKPACKILARKWVLAVLHHLAKRSLRFSELRKLLPGISARSLGTVLQHLEKHGVIRRTIASSRPPRVSYSLASEDPLLREIIQLLARWGAERSKAAGDQ